METVVQQLFLQFCHTSGTEITHLTFNKTEQKACTPVLLVARFRGSYEFHLNENLVYNTISLLSFLCFWTVVWPLSLYTPCR